MAKPRRDDARAAVVTWVYEQPMIYGYGDDRWCSAWFDRMRCWRAVTDRIGFVSTVIPNDVLEGLTRLGVLELAPREGKQKLLYRRVETALTCDQAIEATIAPKTPLSSTARRALQELAKGLEMEAAEEERRSHCRDHDLSLTRLGRSAGLQTAAERLRERARGL